MEQNISTRKQIVLLAMLAFFALALCAPRIIDELPGIYGRVVYLFFPSAERAYELGSDHLDAREASHYDMQRAKFFLEAALETDPAYPYVRHQLSRIAFLEGNFNVALRLINEEIALPNGPASPSSYYMRGLIKGFMGDFDEAAADYEMFLESKPESWAGINDYSWVLLKAGRHNDALEVLDQGLRFSPENPWLHNSRATALYELGRYEEALFAAKKAAEYVEAVTEAEWRTAYPGNDPLIAADGVRQFRGAIAANMRMIEEALGKQ